MNDEVSKPYIFTWTLKLYVCISENISFKIEISAIYKYKNQTLYHNSKPKNFNYLLEQLKNSYLHLRIYTL